MNENRGSGGGRGRGHWNNRFAGRGKWRGRGAGGGWRGRGAGNDGGWRGGWRGRGGGQPGLAPIPNFEREGRSDQDHDSSDLGHTMASQTMATARTFPLTSSQTFWRPFVNGVDFETSEARQSAAKDFLSAASVDDSLEEEKMFSLDYKKLLQDQELNWAWPTLKNDIDENAEFVLGTFGIARHVLQEERNNVTEPKVDAKNCVRRPRLEGHEPVTAIKNVRTNSFGKLVTISATVIRISNVRPMCTWLTFQCEKCASLMSTEQPYGKYQYPAKCVTPQCRSKSFTAQRSHEQTLTVDWQSVRLQEVLFCESGRVPRTIDAELTADLCDVVAPSDIVTVSGVVKAMPVSDQPGNSKSGMFSLYIHAVSLACSNKLKNSTDVLTNKFSDLDLRAVGAIHDCGESLFKLLVASLSPAIYGHDLVKAGLILGLFGGTPKYVGERTHIPVRGDPHILVVGDPGLGKSQMLLACANVAPRGVFVTATGVTTSGLTVTLSKEAGNEFVLEAGALVLADQGCCCIDEFDKMSAQHNALLEAMEQQSVSIAKSGLVCSLPARTGVLAAANPVGGHYNKAKTVSENLKMNPALLSRFDLVFILVDKPNEELDALLSDHIMNMHANRNDDLHRKTTSASITSSLSSQTSLASTSHSSLKERLQRLPGENLDLIPHELMSKYIAYARQYVRPKLSPDACDVLQKFYLELRQSHQNSDCTPITTRQLESLIRLTQARAKLQLREEATREDAEDVVEIMRETMVDIFSDGLGALDFSRAQNGSGMSARAASKRFIAALQRSAQSHQKNCFSLAELKQVAAACGAKVNNFLDFLDSLNTQGFLIKKASGLYQLLTVDY